MPRLIDADALDDVLDEIEGLRAHAAFTDGIMVARRELALAPTIDAKPVRHGRWILKAHDKRVNYLWTVTAYCSECCDEENEIWSGYFPGVPDFMAKDVALDSARTVKLSNYCPNCGAKMGLEVQDEG